MEQQFLSSLNEIKYLLYIILFVVVLGVGANWIRAIATVKGNLRRIFDDQFTEEASALYENEKYSELIDYCQKYLEKRKNNAHALWHLGKAYYKLEKFDKSRDCFERVAQAEPNWEETHVIPYFKKIDEKIDENR